MTKAFTRHQITQLRHDVSEHAGRQGLTGARREDFVLVVHEAVTNAIAHAGGHGQIRLWRSGRLLHCEIVDRGPGISTSLLSDPLPPQDRFGGRGLWLVRRLSDVAAIITGPAGTKVRITFRLARLS